MRKDCLARISERLVERIAGGKAAWNIGHGHAVGGAFFLVNHYRVSHFPLPFWSYWLCTACLQLLYFSPATFKMLFTVPTGRSFFGCGTVITSLRSGCLN